MPEPELLRRLRSAFASLDPHALALHPLACPLCGPSLLLRLNRGDHGARCLRCAASTIHLSLAAAVRARVADIAQRDAYELSARGPLAAWLRRQARSLCLSEYLPDVPARTLREGVRNEDVQSLSFADGTFDLVTHTEVLEHVADDARALAELQRVLRPGGVLAFTVPLHDGEQTVERARLRAGRVEHLLPPIHHGDPLRGGAAILAFRDYGRDILARVRAAGFAQVELYLPAALAPWLSMREVIVARKGPR